MSGKLDREGLSTSDRDVNSPLTGDLRLKHPRCAYDQARP